MSRLLCALQWTVMNLLLLSSSLYVETQASKVTVVHGSRFVESHRAAVIPSGWISGRRALEKSKWVTSGGRKASKSSKSSARSSKGIRIELLHRRNPASPLHLYKNLTGMQRVLRDVHKTQARVQMLNNRLEKALKGRKLQQSYDFTTESVVTPGEYSMSFTIGTPAQHFIAIADTGSDLVWLQCSTCTTCFQQPDALFDPSLSSSYGDLDCTSSQCAALSTNLLQCSPNCKYSYSYGDQSSTTGSFSSETLTLSQVDQTATSITGFSFGCGTDNQGTFSGTDGLVGLGRGPISFPSQLQQLVGGKFSYCLITRTLSSTASSPLLFGEASIPTPATSIIYTALLDTDATIVPYYYVSLEGISVGGSLLDIPSSVFQIDSQGNGGTIFDSGTTYTALVTTAYDTVLSAFQSLITDYTQVDLSSQVGLDLCYDITGLSSLRVPSFVFHFTNGDFVLPVDNIFVQFATNDGSASYMCLALSNSQSLTIFGNVQQQNFHILYDQDNMQLGWLATQCDTL